MNCVNLFFNHKIEVTACKPGCEDRKPESFEPVKSLANQLRAIGDAALAPVRYFFNGQSVHLERKNGEGEGKPKYAAGHVASFHAKTNSVYSRSLSVGYLHSDEKTWLRTAAAIIFLIPGIFIALFTKLPSYLFAETREYNELAHKHFTPISMSVGQKEPLSTLSDIFCSLRSARDENRLDQPVDILTIYTKKDLSCDDTESEKRAKIEHIPNEIFIMEPKKVIFIGLNAMTCRQLFLTTLLKDKWVRNYIETQKEALAAPLQQKNEYFIVKSD